MLAWLLVSGLLLPARRPERLPFLRLLLKAGRLLALLMQRLALEAVGAGAAGAGLERC